MLNIKNRSSFKILIQFKSGLSSQWRNWNERNWTGWEKLLMMISAQFVLIWETLSQHHCCNKIWEAEEVIMDHRIVVKIRSCYQNIMQPRTGRMMGHITKTFSLCFLTESILLFYQTVMIYFCLINEVNFVTEDF